MKAVDTNLLLRYVVRDDPRQFEKAAVFLNERTPEDPAFVGLIVVVEMAWVLRQRYRYRREDILALFMALIEAKELVFEEEAYLSTLLAGEPKGDIADHLIAFCATRAGCSHTVTFDRGAAKAIPSMEFLS